MKLSALARCFPLGLALCCSLSTQATAAAIHNQDLKAYTLVVEGAETAEARMIIEPGGTTIVNDQGMMRIEGQNAFSTLWPENEYYIVNGVFTNKPSAPPAPAVPTHALPDASDKGGW
jgi:hypothetical protein